MSHKSNGGFFAALLLLFLPGMACAGMNKCTDAHGTVSYTDQPCAAAGQKTVEAKGNSDFAAAAALDRKMDLMQTCMQLMERRSQCGSYPEQHLNTAFADNCGPYVKRASMEKQQEYHRRSYNRDYSSYDEKQPEADMPCDALNEAIYKLVKENFSSKISSDEMKAIEYHHAGMPADNRQPDYSDRRRRRR